MSDGLFEIQSVAIAADDQVDITMPWNETWRCKVVQVGHRDGWPVAHVHRNDGAPWGPDDVFTVDLARCRLVGTQPALEGL